MVHRLMGSYRMALSYGELRRQQSASKESAHISLLTQTFSEIVLCFSVCFAQSKGEMRVSRRFFCLRQFENPHWLSALLFYLLIYLEHISLEILISVMV